MGLQVGKNVILPRIDKLQDPETKRVIQELLRVIQDMNSTYYNDLVHLKESDSGGALSYEEGTWTMGVSFGEGTAGITYSVNTGYYTKIGNICTISGYIQLTAKGSSTGNVLITGLPFTVVNNVAGYTAVALYFKDITFANQFHGYTRINTTKIALLEITEAGVVTTLTDANFTNNSQIVVNCTYRTE